MDMQFFASYSAMSGPIPGACLKFVTCTDQLLCMLELWHFSRFALPITWL